MAAITAKQVAELRAKTGLGMMNCKNALVEADGDMEKAIKILREKGLATATKKESRIAAEGVVDILKEGNVTAMIEVNSETDFVAKNESFKEFVKGLLKTLVDKKPADMDAFLALPFNGTPVAVKDALVEKIAIIGEKLSIRRFVIVDGITSTYIHGNGAAGVIVKFDTDSAIAAKPEFVEFSKNIALQIAAGNPPQYVNIEDVPASEVNEEKNILIQQMKNDPKNANKPEAILEKIVVGRLDKFYERVCLVEQGYIKEDSLKVGQYVAACAKELGGNIRIDSFTLFEKGEGIQKREENFAEEIAKLANNQ